MLGRAKLSFTGVVSMTKGEVREISDFAIAKDLLKAGYIEEVKPKAKRKKGEKE